MPPPSGPPVPRAAQPVHGRSFDPWNSSSTGHQRAETAPAAGTGWRESRNRKLMSQFVGGVGGGGGSSSSRVSDAVGGGAAQVRARHSVMDMLAKPGTMTCSSSSPSASVGEQKKQQQQQSVGRREEGSAARSKQAGRASPPPPRTRPSLPPRRLFDGVVAYLNGSTHPLISDHKLKHVLAQHGGSLSSHLGRRKVTHVIVGRPTAGAGGGEGCGGGLAGGKLQREITKIGGPAVKYVGVQWVLESIKAGKRLPEARFADLKVASKGQKSVYGLYSKHSNGTSADVGDVQPPPSGQALDEDGSTGNS